MRFKKKGKMTMMMYMLFPDAKRKALTFSYGDGMEHDICPKETP